MKTRDIRTSYADADCDVCGRTLLRGERAELFLDGGARRSVCELCKSHALHEGWVREGTAPVHDESDMGSERNRSLLHRLRGRRGAGAESAFADEPDRRSRPASGEDPGGGAGQDHRSSRLREPRHVHAVPSSAEHKTVSAVQMFNGSEHRRTVAGVARSLGLPAVSVLPSGAQQSLVNVVVSWELCWYRYEVDLSDERSSVRLAGQGYELSELTPPELSPNAVSDENGALALRAELAR
ncbi:MAG: hypothetical protein DLM64_02160 [Solirubrobacterales bacterium]|nr:MAG: hypothetical protein DLM64_02160 [Solirubrobacterales bacterium]